MQTKHEERGFTVVEVILGITLIMVPMALFALGFPRFEADKQFTSAAASQIARTISTSGDPDTDRAEAIARAVADNYNIEPSSVNVQITAMPSAISDPSSDDQIVVTVSLLNASGAPSGDVERGGSVEVDVRVRTSLFPVPWVKDKVTAVASSHRVEMVDRYGSFEDGS